jgi:hypothetical protein
MKRYLFVLFAICLLMNAAEAVTVWEIRRDCGTDGKTYCPKSGYGEPMKACLNLNLAKLTLQCKAIMKRINGGEKLRLF